jgi:hypothetical protein
MTVDAASTSNAQTISRDSPTTWCSDASTRDNVIARRNVLAGLWASRLMQTPTHLVQSYAAEVHHVDFSEPGDDDVITKIFGDLTRCGITITREEVRRKLCEFHRQAMQQTRETD